jgi:hypothetical protein
VVATAQDTPAPRAYIAMSLTRVLPHGKMLPDGQLSFWLFLNLFIG